MRTEKDNQGQQQRLALTGSRILLSASLPLCEILKVERGAEIVSSGVGEGFIYFVESGFCASVKSYDDNARQLVAIHVPGDLLNHEELTVGLATQASALSKATLARISLGDFRKVLASDPLHGRLFLRFVAYQGVLSHAWLFRTGRLNAMQKIAHLLCEVHHRMQTAGLVEAGVSPMPLTQSEMGAALGLSIVHVNRSLQKLRDAGLVQIGRQRFAILDWPATAKMARFDEKYLQAATESGGDFSNRCELS